MSKGKKKHSKKNKGTDGILDVAALSVSKFRKVTKEIGKLSTGQKLVGALALAAAGLTYLATQQAGAETPSADDGPAAKANEKRATTDDEAPRPAPARKSRKAPKA